MIGWSFPPNNHGQVVGLNDAGIETFKDDIFKSLAREVNQNSCDARDASGMGPVEVHFDCHEQPISIFPMSESFLATLDACKSYWSQDPRSSRFFQRATELLQSPTIRILRISDYNTTGLTGSKQDRHSNWLNLIKSAGVSNKAASAGGSFGIGKNAPFACSELRTVFYGTKDIEETVAFQGVAKLVTHLNGDGDQTQGIGYYGDTQRNTPIFDLHKVDEFYRRTDIGTDLFVMGFCADPDWEERVIKSVLESFFLAIYHQTLVVHVGDIIINDRTLPELIDRYVREDSLCLSGAYYDALKTDRSHYFRLPDFKGMGELELRLLPGKGYPKRVAMVRATGMKIYDKGHFRTPMRFAGVLIAKGDRLNEFLRSIEPPSHNSWEPERYEDDRPYAHSLVKEIYTWIKEMVREVAASDEEEEMDAAGISQYLPDDPGEEPPFPDQEEGDGTRHEEGQVEIRNHYSEPPYPAISLPSVVSEVASDPEGDQGGLQEDGSRTSQDSDPDAGAGTGRLPNDTGDPAMGLDEEGKRSANVRKPIEIHNLRIYRCDSKTGTYRVSFTPTCTVTAYLRLRIMGEVGHEPALVSSAAMILGNKFDNGLEVVDSQRIGPIQMQSGVKVVLAVTLTGAPRCALEVVIDEN